MDLQYCCAFCGVGGRLLRCSGCKLTYYCTKEHQKQDWKKHRKLCQSICSHNSSGSTHVTVNNVSSKFQNSLLLPDGLPRYSPGLSNMNLGLNNGVRDTSPITFEGSSESEIISAEAEELDHILEYLQSEINNPPVSGNVETPVQDSNQIPNFNEVSVEYPDIGLGLHNVHGNNLSVYNDSSAIDDICRTVINDMDLYGVCVVDNFLGHDNGLAVLGEVTGMYQTGVFKDGQLVSNRVKKDLKTIRGDQITWVDGKESCCQHIGTLIRKVDEVIMRANTMLNNGKMGDFIINGRTKVSKISRMLL